MKIWILNHYAGNMRTDKGGRHYCLSKYLNRAGYNPVVFCSINKKDQKELWTEKVAEEINTPFVYVRVDGTRSNGLTRVVNMVSFCFNVQKAAKQYAKDHGKPDVILASSVHPLTLVAGLKLAKYFNVKCICEVRDLWPESLVAYGHLKRHSILAKVLYYYEKRIYMKADRVVMTWPGGYDYIIDKGWDSDIPKEKVIHISNGVDLDQYKENIVNHPYSDDELSNDSIKKIIYAGSIREVNNLGMIVSAAEILQTRGISGFKILVYGSGTERDALIRRVEEAHLSNISFVGRVPKENIPFVLSKAFVTLLHNTSTELNKYGQSQNKFFEYLAAGRPVLMTYSVGHSICKENNCGFEIDEQSPESIADAIEHIVQLKDDEYQIYSHNAEETAKRYDFKDLTKKLVSIIESL